MLNITCGECGGVAPVEKIEVGVVAKCECGASQKCIDTNPYITRWRGFSEEKEQLNEFIEKIKKIVEENYDSDECGYTSERSEGNSDDVFSDGESCGRSWLAYEIGLILGMNLEEPVEPKYSWED